MKNKRQSATTGGMKNKKIRAFVAGRKKQITRFAGTLMFVLCAMFSFSAHAAVTHNKTSELSKIVVPAMAMLPMAAYVKFRPTDEGGGENEEKKALLDEIKKQFEQLNKSNVTKSDFDELKKKFDDFVDKASKESKTPEGYADLVKEHIKLMEDFKAVSEKGSIKGVKTLKEYIMENSEVLKNIKAKAKGNDVAGIKHFNITVDKATQGATDIGSRDYLGTIEPGIEKKPIRAPRILDLFRRKPVGTEYLHYWEENVVTRDAKFVIACATSTHNTKKTWVKRTVELAKIRDIVDICIDMLDDYAFVQSELTELVTESITLAADYELLLGASVATTDMLSIDSISSEFNPANPLAVYTGAFKAATIGDLTAAMKAQIFTFGQEKAWDADTVIMNYNDMIKYLHAKDENNNYLFPNFVYGSTDIVNGMRIVTSPIVAQNTLYVLDSSKGSILDRKLLTVNSYFENRDNAEHELVTFVGVERLQFHVRLINRDAFMKCSDIATALAAITA